MSSSDPDESVLGVLWESVECRIGIGVFVWSETCEGVDVLKDDGAKDGVVGTIVLALPVVRFETLRIGCGLPRTGGCEPDGSEGRGRE